MDTIWHGFIQSIWCFVNITKLPRLGIECLNSPRGYQPRSLLAIKEIDITVIYCMLIIILTPLKFEAKDIMKKNELQQMMCCWCGIYHTIQHVVIIFSPGKASSNETKCIMHALTEVLYHLILLLKQTLLKISCLEDVSCIYILLLINRNS